MHKKYIVLSAVAAVAIGAVAALLWFGRPAGGGAADALPASLLKGDMSVFEPAAAKVAAPGASFQAADGSPTSLADRRGRVVLVNFWATWCAPCVEELPSLDRLQAALGGDDFEVVAISVDREGIKAAGPFLAELAVAHLALYADPRMAMMQAVGARGLPTTVLFDRSGSEVGRLAGPADWNAAETRKLIGHVIARPVARQSDLRSESKGPIGPDRPLATATLPADQRVGIGSSPR